MPAQFYTASGVNADFGLQAESAFGFLVENFGYDVSSDKAEVFDENGDLVHTHRYNKKASISISGIGTAGVGVGDTIASLTNTAGGQLTGTILVDQVVTTKSSSDFEKVEISATQYDKNLS